VNDGRLRMERWKNRVDWRGKTQQKKSWRLKPIFPRQILFFCWWKSGWRKAGTQPLILFSFKQVQQHYHYHY